MGSISTPLPSFACGYLPAAVCNLIAPSAFATPGSTCVGDQCLAAALGPSSDSFSSAKLSCSSALIATVTPTAPTVYVTEIAVATKLDTTTQYITSYETVSAYVTEVDGLTTTVTAKDIVATETDYVTASPSRLAKRQGSACQPGYVSPDISPSASSTNMPIWEAGQDQNIPSSAPRNGSTNTMRNITLAQASLLSSELPTSQSQLLSADSGRGVSVSRMGSSAPKEADSMLPASGPSKICACQAPTLGSLVVSQASLMTEQSGPSPSIDATSPVITKFIISETLTPPQSAISLSSPSIPGSITANQVVPTTLPAKPSTSLRFVNTTFAFSTSQSGMPSQIESSSSPAGTLGTGSAKSLSDFTAVNPTLLRTVSLNSQSTPIPQESFFTVEATVSSSSMSSFGSFTVTIHPTQSSRNSAMTSSPNSPDMSSSGRTTNTLASMMSSAGSPSTLQTGASSSVLSSMESTVNVISPSVAASISASVFAITSGGMFTSSSPSGSTKPTSVSTITQDLSAVSSTSSFPAEQTSCPPGAQSSVCSCLGVTRSTVTAQVTPITLTLPARTTVTVQATRTGISILNTTVGVTHTATTFSTATVTDLVTSTVDITINPSATVCAPFTSTSCDDSARATFALKAASSDSSIDGKYIQLVDSDFAEVDQGYQQQPAFTSNRCLASNFNINSDKHLSDTKGSFANIVPNGQPKNQFYLDDAATIEVTGSEYYLCSLFADGTLGCQVNGLTKFAYCPKDQEDFGNGLVLANVANGLDTACTPLTVKYEMISCGD